MDEEYTIVYVDNPEQSVRGIIEHGLDRHSRHQAVETEFQHLCFVLYDPDQEIVGGVIGDISWGWLHIELLWVEEKLRDRGYGHHLLTHVENKALQLGAKSVYLNTFSFQALDFYQQQGYKVFGELQDYPPGHQRYFLTKKLDAAQ